MPTVKDPEASLQDAFGDRGTPEAFLPSQARLGPYGQGREEQVRKKLETPARFGAHVGLML